MSNEVSPFSRRFYLMIKPVGAACNLTCEYCYYLEKGALNAENNVSQGALASQQKKQMMSHEMLETVTREYIQAQSTGEVLFTWHGGEPLLASLSFYERAVALQRKYAGGRIIDNCIQTNGTLLNDEWCRFFKANNWLVGISIDGTAAMHNLYRRSRRGEDTHARVMRAIELLNKHGVEWNAMAVVNSHNADSPLEFYRFFKNIGCRYIQFSPIVERRINTNGGSRLAEVTDEAEITPSSVTPEQWGSFLCAIFDEWRQHDVGSTFVQLFDATLANWVGEAPGVCVLSPRCGNVGVVEWNGDIYSCDHFVFPSHKLGNIRSTSILQAMFGSRQYAFSRMKQSLPSQCLACPFLFACNGECPKNRFVVTADGAPRLNYLCKGYREFFVHAAPYMEFMKDELLAGRAPANVMNAFSFL